MRYTTVTARNRPTQRHGWNQSLLHRLIPHLLLLSVSLFAAAVLLAVFLPAGDNRIGSLAADMPVFSGPIQSSPLPNLPEPTISAPATPEPAGEDSWKLLLVNSWNPLPENYSVQTVELRNGYRVDERCYPDLQAMMDACRADGLSPVICSAYRTWEYQERLYQAEIERWLVRGYSQDSAKAEAGKAVAIPGTSEHQLGLAVDIVDIGYQLLDEAQENTAVQRWLMEHSWEYGFILRYPSGKGEITGIIYEPWHYRYVGREDAERIYALDICLEEYLECIE